MFSLHIKFSEFFLQQINSELKRQKYTLFHGKKLRNTVELY